MSHLRETIYRGRTVLRRVDEDGEGDLLVLTPPQKNTDAPLPPYARSLFDRVFEKVEPKLGPWRSVTVASCDGKLVDTAKKLGGDRVLLVGKAFSGAISNAAKLPPEESGVLGVTNRYGLLVEHSGRRWVNTFYPSVYGVGSQTNWKQASLLGHLYRHLELLRIGLPGWDDPSEPVKTRLVRNADDWRELRKLLKRKRVVAIDTETTSLRRINNTVLTIQFGFDGKTGWVLPVAHPDSELSSDLLREILTFLRDYFERAERALHVYCNAPFDMHVLITLLSLRWYNHDAYDVQAAEFAMDENRMFRDRAGLGRKGHYTLERLCLEYGMQHYLHTEVGKGDRDKLQSVPLKKVAPYAATDVALPIRVMKMQLAVARFRDSMNPEKPYRRFLRCITDVGGRKLQQFTFMERNGLLVDKRYSVFLQGPSSPVLKEIREEEAKFKRLPEVLAADALLKKNANVRTRKGGLFGDKKGAAVATAFSPGKPAHQQLLFFEVMKLPVLNRTDAGTPSVDDEFKKKHADNPVVKAFAQFEEAKKMLSTFVVGYFKLLRNEADNADGRLRTHYSSLFVITDRSSSSDPNLQNVPVRNKKKAKVIKRQFVAARGRLMVKRDFSAHEVRMWGAASGDPKIGDVFWSGMQIRLRYEAQRSISAEKAKFWDDELKAADVHRQNVNLFYGTDPRKVDEEARGKVKKTIFGAVYGKGLKAIAKDIKASEEDARKLWKLIFRKKFRVGGDWLLRTQKRASRTLVAKNVLGGVRHLYGYLHTENSAHAAMNRRGPNAIVQGPSSNIGYVGGYFARKLVWDLYESRGVSLGYLQCNAVHDSTEAEGAIVNIPLIEYLQHHAFTTMVHRWLRDSFDVELKVGFEMDSEIGAALSDMKKAPRWDSQVDAIAAGIEWGNKELGWGLDLDAHMKIVRHNAAIVFDVRRAEIARQLERGERTNYHMFVNRKNALDLGLIFEAPKSKSKRDGERSRKTRSAMRELEDA